MLDVTRQALRASGRQRCDDAAMSELRDRWPHIDAPRPIPVYPHGAEDPAAAAALRDLMYLDELERQARVFTSSFGDAMTAALVANDDQETWRHLQSAVFAAIVVNRLVDAEGANRGWPGVSGKEALNMAEDRAARLRALVGLPEPGTGVTAIFDVRDVRNSMEHIDQRLDRVSHDAEVSGGVADWYLSDGRVSVALSAGVDVTPLGFRAFIPTSSLLLFNDKTLNLFSLDIDMLALQHNINEVRPKLAKDVRGNKSYGSQLAEFPSGYPAYEGFKKWESARAESLSTLEAQELVGVKVWLRAQDRPAEPCQDKANTF